MVAPEDAIACRLSFDRIDFTGALLVIESPEGNRLEEIYDGYEEPGQESKALTGNHFVPRFTTRDVPDWGFHMNRLTCKY